MLGIYGKLLRTTAALKILGRRLLDWRVALIFLGQFEVGLLAWATRFVDISVATILMELWPMLLVFVVFRLFASRERYVQPTILVMAMLTAGFGGVALVILSQSVGGEGINGGPVASLILGCLLSFGAALCIAPSGLGVSWGIGVAKDLAAIRDQGFR